MPRPRLLHADIAMVAVAMVAAASTILVSTSRAQFAGETSNAGNVFEAAPEFPDRNIAVTAVDAPSPVGAGELLAVSAGVANLEGAQTSFDLVLTDLSDGSVLDTVAVSLAGFETGIIDLTWDTGASALGTHDLQVEAVVPGDIDPSDNTGTVRVRVQVTKHDIALRRLDGPRRIGLGGLANLTVEVRNKGNRTETFDLVLTDTSTGSEIDRQTLTLGTGVDVDASFTWDTTGAALGDHVLAAEAVVAGDANPRDNTKTTKVTVEEAERDIEVAGIDTPGRATHGDVVTVEIDLDNKGNIDITCELVLRDTTDGVVLATVSVTVPLGGSSVVTIEWDTAAATLGRHTLEAEAVVVDDIQPVDNTRTTRVTIDP